MSYVLTGTVQGHVSPEQVEPLANVTVRLYRTEEQSIGRSFEMEPRFAALSAEEVREKEYLWTAQARTNERGEFTIDLSERSLLGHVGSTRPYQGEALEVDVYCRSAPGQPQGSTGGDVQFTVGTIVPAWASTGEGYRATWSCVLSHAFWSQARTAMDAWTVMGRVTSRASQIPLAGLRVHAFDADLYQDDPLGSATTDEQGKFRIDFPGQLFRRVPGKGVDFESKGPDVYFRIEGPDGTLLIAEDRGRANSPDRRDVGTVLDTELVVDS